MVKHPVTLRRPRPESISSRDLAERLKRAAQLDHWHVGRQDGRGRWTGLEFTLRLCTINRQLSGGAELTVEVSQRYQHQPGLSRVVWRRQLKKGWTVFTLSRAIARFQAWWPAQRELLELRERTYRLSEGRQVPDELPTGHGHSEMYSEMDEAACLFWQRWLLTLPHKAK